MNVQGEKNDFAQIAELLDKLSTAINELTNLGVIRSRKFIPDFAEWLVANIYGGSVAKSKTQKHWDVKVGSEKLQVKAHSKAIGNPNRWSLVKCPDRFDILVIIVLTKDFKVREFYRILSGKLKPYLNPYKRDYKVNWNDIVDWKLFKGDIPNFNDFSVFFT